MAEQLEFTKIIPKLQTGLGLGKLFINFQNIITFMQSKKLAPNQIITLNDFPLHNEHFLKIFFRIYQKRCGKIIPPIPVIPKDLVVPHFDAKLKKKFDNFYRK